MTWWTITYFVHFADWNMQISGEERKSWKAVFHTIHNFVIFHTIYNYTNPGLVISRVRKCKADSKFLQLGLLKQTHQNVLTSLKICIVLHRRKVWTIRNGLIFDLFHFNFFIHGNPFHDNWTRELQGTRANDNWIWKIIIISRICDKKESKTRRVTVWLYIFFLKRQSD